MCAFCFSLPMSMHSWEITKISVLHGSKDRLIGLLSSPNCPVILPCEEEMKKQRWPGGVCLYFRISAVASAPPPPLPTPPTPLAVSVTQSESQVRTLYCGVSQTRHGRGPERTVGRRNSPLTKSGAHDSFITSLAVSKVSTACLWSDNLHIEGVLEFLLSIKMLNGKWFL